MKVQKKSEIRAQRDVKGFVIIFLWSQMFENLVSVEVRFKNIVCIQIENVCVVKFI